MLKTTQAHWASGTDDGDAAGVATDAGVLVRIGWKVMGSSHPGNNESHTTRAILAENMVILMGFNGI
jgi:hypothetical protein